MLERLKFVECEIRNSCGNYGIKCQNCGFNNNVSCDFNLWYVDKVTGKRKTVKYLDNGGN